MTICGGSANGLQWAQRALTVGAWTKANPFYRCALCLFSLFEGIAGSPDAEAGGAASAGDSPVAQQPHNGVALSLPMEFFF
jgi:hypothetical protein